MYRYDNWSHSKQSRAILELLLGAVIGQTNVSTAAAASDWYTYLELAYRLYYYIEVRVGEMHYSDELYTYLVYCREVDQQ